MTGVQTCALPIYSQWFLKAMEDDAVALKEAGVDDIIKAIVIEEII